MNFKTLGVCGGNGVILHTFHKNSLIGNIEPRSIFHTHNDIQWDINFNCPIDKNTKAKYSKSQVDIIIGAPDCGHSSVFAYSRAKQMSNPDNNESLNVYIDSIRYYQPALFLMENLPALVDNMGKDLERIFPNYRLKQFIGPVSLWGNSQITRIRLVIIGIHKSLPINYDKEFILPKPDSISLKNSGDLIRDLGIEPISDLCHVREHDDFMVNMYYGDSSRISLKKVRKLWLTEFRDKKKWPVNKGNLKNQPGINRNFADDYPLTVRKQNRQFNHLGYVLTPREMARIQGIPDSFKIWYDPTKYNYCINKGRVTVTKTPPYEIGKWFHDIIEKL
jgi:site-specific DNA-cytosine methylase